MCNYRNMVKSLLELLRLELPDPKSKFGAINKMCQTLFADSETKQPGTASAYITNHEFPSKPSGLIRIVSWEPSHPPSLQSGSLEMCSLTRAKNSPVNTLTNITGQCRPTESSGLV